MDKPTETGSTGHQPRPAAPVQSTTAEKTRVRPVEKRSTTGPRRPRSSSPTSSNETSEAPATRRARRKPRSANANGRTALVTGAARGIGAAVARKLADDGWNLVLVDICADDPFLGYALGNADDLAQVAKSCGGSVGVATVACDVRDSAGLHEAVELGIRRFGSVHAAVAAAGAIAGGRTAWQTSEIDWSTMIGVNLEGVWRTARAVIPALMATPEPRRGRFVALASAGGVRGLPQLAAYCASKHGVIGLIRSLAVELAPHGITANAVAPGSTDTEMLRATTAIYGLSSPVELAAHHPNGQLVQPEEVAALVAWLCSPDSSAVTGAVLPVDNGMTAT